MKSVLETTKKILPDLQFVEINKSHIEEFASDITLKDFDNLGISLSKYDWPKEKLLELTFLFNTINFCFWAGKDEKKWTIKDDNLDGAVALFRCLENELKRNPDFLSPGELADMSLGRIGEILKGNITIPLLPERLGNVKEFGKVVEEKYHSKILNILEEAEFDGYKLAEILVDNFACFDDVSNIDETTVAFYKRAQLNSKMLHDILESFGESGLKGIEKLTAFADYKIPQRLRYLGIISYAEDLANKIDNFVLLPEGSREEVEIRVATIWAIEYLKDALNSRFDFVTASHVDNFLWNNSQTKIKKEKLYHRTLTTAY